MPEIDVTATVVPIPGTSNLRDVGGYPVAEDRVVRSGVFYRSEVLAVPGSGEKFAVFDEEAAEQYDAMGVRTVVDLRTSQEIARVESRWTAATGADLVLLELPEGGEGTDTDVIGDLLGGRRTRFDVADLAELYVGGFDRRGAEYGAIARILADPDRTPALVHCSAGKDRTGSAVALVLDAIGVPRDVVLDDYALTGILRPGRVDAYADVFAGVGLAPDAVRVLFETPREAMAAALTHVDLAYGGSAAYLRERGGLGEDEVAVLRDNLTEVRPAPS